MQQERSEVPSLRSQPIQLILRVLLCACVRVFSGDVCLSGCLLVRCLLLLYARTHSLSVVARVVATRRWLPRGPTCVSLCLHQPFDAPSRLR